MSILEDPIHASGATDKPGNILFKIVYIFWSQLISKTAVVSSKRNINTYNEWLLS